MGEILYNAKTKKINCNFHAGEWARVYLKEGPELRTPTYEGKIICMDPVFLILENGMGWETYIPIHNIAYINILYCGEGSTPFSIPEEQKPF